MLKKIAVVASGNIPSKWANSINTVRHANAFQELGYEVTLHSVLRLAQEREKKNIDDIWGFYGVKKIPLCFERDSSLSYFNVYPLVRVCTSALNRISKGRFIYWRDPERKISNKLKNEGVDLCFARSYRVVEYNIKNNIPTIMETHNNRPEKSKELMKILKKSDNKYLVSIITIHEKIKRKLVNLGVDKNKIFVFDDAVDKSYFDSISDDKILNRKVFGLPKDKKIIGYMGSLKPGKAIHKILETANSCDDDRLLFVIAGGDEKEIESWKKYCFYKSKNTKFLGFLEGKISPCFLKSCDVLFMPYDLNETNAVMDLETTSPIKLFEYMASKRPIVSSRIPVIENILDDKVDGILIEDGNYLKIILELCCDEVLANRLSSNALNKSEKYTYLNRCKNILASSSLL